MKILVCVKQVPESEAAIEIDEHGTWIQPLSVTDFKMSRLDEYAVEEALRLRQTVATVHITAVTVGPERCVDAVKRSIGMGADAGVHIQTDTDGYIRPAMIAAWIAQYAGQEEYALIFTGAMSEDHMHGQVGPMIAAHLHLPCATGVIFQRLAADQKTIYVEREIEGGNRDMVALKLPAVVTIQSGINTPRYPSLSNLLRANKQMCARILPETLRPLETSETILQVLYPLKSRAGKVLEGTGQEKASALLQLMREKAFLE